MSFLNPYSHNSGGGHDPFFSSVVMLAHWDGTNGQTAPFINSCPRGTTINTASTGASLTTTSPLFGPTCLTLVGNNAYPSSNSHADYLIGTADFTIEFGCKTATPSQAADLFDMRTAGTSVEPTVYITSSQFRYFVNGADRITGGTVATSTWQRIAVSRIGTSTKMFLDGTQIGSTYTDSNNYLQAKMTFGGANFTAGGSFAGQIDELRVTNGVGRYSGTYTLDIVAFPNL